jgi:NTP pyrophosphatase (non-canonical NTP hydrolase)
MCEELDNNSHKDGWQTMSPQECLTRAKQELGELERALKSGASHQRILSEAADVANFCFFIADNAEGDR